MHQRKIGGFIMKRFICLMGILALCSFAYAQDFNLAFSVRNTEENNSLGYWLVCGLNIQDNVRAEIEIGEKYGGYYFNTDTQFIQEWQHLGLSIRRKYIVGEVNDIYLQALGRIPVNWEQWDPQWARFIYNGFWEVGIRQSWDDDNIPSTNIVLGKVYEKELNSVKFSYSLYSYSDDSKKWNWEAETEIRTPILTNFDFFLEYTLYLKCARLKTGLEIKL
jgi:hypothetical protein